MRRIDEEEARSTIDEDKPKNIAGPLIASAVCLGLAFWAYNHISNGCTDFNLGTIFTYCSGKTGSVIVTH